MFRKGILILLLCLFGFVNGQNNITDISIYKALYELAYQQDSTDINSVNKEMMFLLIGKKNSLFQSENSKYNDSIRMYYTYNTKLDEQAVINKIIASKKKSRFDFKILKTPTKIIVLDRVFSDKFIYEDSKPLNWKIINETKTINSYLCQKATTNFGGRNYVAWFTNEIPISDGPYKFRGLPGLIINLHDTKKQYNFQLFSFKKYSTNFSFQLNGIQKVNRKAYFKAYRDFKSNFIEQLEQRGIMIEQADGERIRYSIRKKRNNEIEIN